jgi:hypothetical protein
MRPIAVHPRKEEGRFSTLPKHIDPRKISGVERGATWLLKKVSAIGSQTQRWAEAMTRERGIEAVRVLQGMVALAGKHPPQHIETACEVALSHEAFRLRTIRQLIARHDRITAEQLPLPLLEEHPIIRPLSDYGQLVRSSFTQTPVTHMETCQ